ncbi:MAG: 50S ribosomal protein L25 [Candidatus Eremiobacteraeota bacterium]|nr:50S ribosomal protein L25 [Candidatus Eremiobacteraeota bacterium]MBC5803597.1 50S ribosomal protein L25 [Candidatus Eremiobacteraeota bacterium]MBC5822676.1 50S ribosomal protein L25 [Candidatus Eremiobacteraeota bacterium]
MGKPDNALAASTRAKTGTTASAALRRSGKIPASLFGHGSAPTAVALDAKAFDALLHAGGKNQLLDITLDGGTPDTALVREVQRDPITRRVVHADLQRVSATEEIDASLPLVAVGVAEGVKNGGGVMDIVFHTVEVSGRANALPEALEADVSALVIGGHFTAGDLKLPAGLKLEMDPATVLISIEASRTAAEAAEAAPAAPEEPALVGEPAPE